MFYIHFEIVFVLSCVNIKTFSVCLISNTVSHFASKDQATALHVVIHDVLKNRCEFFVVDQIEEYFLIGGDVYSDITLDEVKQTFMLEFEILGPVPHFGFLVIDSLEEQDIARTSANKAGFFDQKHGSEINVTDLFQLSFNCFINFSHFLNFDSESFTLSVKRVDFLLSLVPETFVWEIKW